MPLFLLQWMNRLVLRSNYWYKKVGILLLVCHLSLRSLSQDACVPERPGLPGNCVRTYKMEIAFERAWLILDPAHIVYERYVDCTSDQIFSAGTWTIADSILEIHNGENITRFEQIEFGRYHLLVPQDKRDAVCKLLATRFNGPPFHSTALQTLLRMGERTDILIYVLVGE